MKNQFISTLSIIKNAVKSIFLFKNIWKENTTMLLHGKREDDKTAIAVDIAAALSKEGREVLYVDTQSRIDDYADRLAGADKMLVFRPAYDSPDDKTDYADLVIAGIEEAVATTGIRTFVIDSLTRIAALSFGRNASAAYVMKRLVALQVRCGLSMLVIAHDTTKSSARALLNLADSELNVSLDNALEPACGSSNTINAKPLTENVVSQASAISEESEIEDSSTETLSESPEKPSSAPSPKSSPRYIIPSLRVVNRPYPSPMNRSERRALERRQRKMACRNRR